MTAVASASVAATMSGLTAFGSMCRTSKDLPPHADGTRRVDVLRLAHAQERATQQAREDRHVEDRDGEGDLRHSLAEEGDDGDREQETGNGQHDVDAAHDHRVGLAAEVARDRADSCAEGNADDHRQRRDPEGETRPEDDPGEHVLALHVRAEPVLR